MASRPPYWSKIVPAVVRPTEALADLLLSAALVAVTVTEGLLGRVAGAVYSPEVEMVPTVALPPAVPLTAQVTPVFVVPVTLAVNCCVEPVLTVADVGATATATVLAATGAGIVTLAVADFVGSATLVTFTVALPPVEEIVVGAV